MRRLWKWLKEKVTGRRYFYGVDPAGSNGDACAIVEGYVDRKGIFYITRTTAFGQMTKQEAEFFQRQLKLIEENFGKPHQTIYPYPWWSWRKWRNRIRRWRGLP